MAEPYIFPLSHHTLHFSFCSTVYVFGALQDALLGKEVAAVGPGPGRAGQQNA